MDFETLIEGVRRQLTEPLPGEKAQYRMASYTRKDIELRNIKPRDDVRVAAVLAMLYPKDGESHIALMQRTDRGAHAGQVSFPGGGVEEQDNDLIDTALREAQEEVNIQPNDVQILGELTPLHIPISNSMVHPIVGYSHVVPDYVAEPEEVKAVIEAPLADFFNPDKLKTTDMRVPTGFVLKDTPYFDIKDYVVWGATAMMMNELLEVIKLGTSVRNAKV